MHKSKSVIRHSIAGILTLALVFGPGVPLHATLIQIPSITEQTNAIPDASNPHEFEQTHEAQQETIDQRNDTEGAMFAWHGQNMVGGISGTDGRSGSGSEKDNPGGWGTNAAGWSPSAGSSVLLPRRLPRAMPVEAETQPGVATDDHFEPDHLHVTVSSGGHDSSSEGGTTSQGCMIEVSDTGITIGSPISNSYTDDKLNIQFRRQPFDFSRFFPFEDWGTGFTSIYDSFDELNNTAGASREKFNQKVEQYHIGLMGSGSALSPLELSYGDSTLLRSGGMNQAVNNFWEDMPSVLKVTRLSHFSFKKNEFNAVIILPEDEE